MKNLIANYFVCLTVLLGLGCSSTLGEVVVPKSLFLTRSWTPDITEDPDKQLRRLALQDPENFIQQVLFFLKHDPDFAGLTLQETNDAAPRTQEADEVRQRRAETRDTAYNALFYTTASGELGAAFSPVSEEHVEAIYFVWPGGVVSNHAIGLIPQLADQYPHICFPALDQSLNSDIPASVENALRTLAYKSFGETTAHHLLRVRMIAFDPDAIGPKVAAQAEEFERRRTSNVPRGGTADHRKPWGETRMSLQYAAFQAWIRMRPTTQESLSWETMTEQTKPAAAGAVVWMYAEAATRALVSVDDLSHALVVLRALYDTPTAHEWIQCGITGCIRVVADTVPNQALKDSAWATLDTLRPKICPDDRCSFFQAARPAPRPGE